MRVERIRELLNAQPFRSFVMHLAGGREIAVHHQEFVAMSPSGRTVVVYQPDDSMNIVDLLLLTDLEINPNGPPAGRSGTPKQSGP